jgi:hypothetical protein
MFVYEGKIISQKKGIFSYGTATKNLAQYAFLCVYVRNN